MKLWIGSRRIFRAVFPALALGSLILATAGSAPAHADAATVPGTAIAVGGANTATYADDSDKGKKGGKGGTEPIVIGPPIIVPDPPKPPPKKKN